MLAELLRFINGRHGTGFVAGARYPTGEQGAFAIAAGDERCVLKWRRGTDLPPGLVEAVAVTGRLRALGYPAPRYRIVGFAPALGIRSSAPRGARTRY